MLYKNDINYFKPATIYRGEKRHFKPNCRRNNDLEKKKSTKAEITSIWRRYCECTPTHGLRYLADENIHRFERYKNT